MKILTTLVTAALLTVFGACTDGQPKTPQTPSGAAAPAAELTDVALELPGMD